MLASKILPPDPTGVEMEGGQREDSKSSLPLVGDIIVLLYESHLTAIRVNSWWLDERSRKGQLPKGFPLETVKKAMKMIMKNNVFEFGDLHFLQLIGTAMDTSAAVI